MMTVVQAGNCNKPHCIFRHLEVGSKKRNVTPCYWETQPQVQYNLDLTP